MAIHIFKQFWNIPRVNFFLAYLLQPDVADVIMALIKLNYMWIHT